MQTNKAWVRSLSIKRQKWCCKILLKWICLVKWESYGIKEEKGNDCRKHCTFVHYWVLRLWNEFCKSQQDVRVCNLLQTATRIESWCSQNDKERRYKFDYLSYWWWCKWCFHDLRGSYRSRYIWKWRSACGSSIWLCYPWVQKAPPFDAIAW